MKNFRIAVMSAALLLTIGFVGCSKEDGPTPQPETTVQPNPTPIDTTGNPIDTTGNDTNAIDTITTKLVTIQVTSSGELTALHTTNGDYFLVEYNSFIDMWTYMYYLDENEYITVNASTGISVGADWINIFCHDEDTTHFSDKIWNTSTSYTFINDSN